MNFQEEIIPTVVLHWNYRGFTEFPIRQLSGEENDITDIYLKENLISCLPSDIGRLENLESLYLSGNDIRELPREISKLRCLKCLDVSGNRLKCLPDEIGDVKSLKFLILDENELSELPLRISELRALRYLSVCDNKLTWLPQRPVYNYHHCEFRFWRNHDLKAIPYSLWYHMFRDQQTRSLNIGCLTTSDNQSLPKRLRCRLKLQQDSREWEVDVLLPPQYRTILVNNENIPPSLYELSKRRFYQKLCDAAKNLGENYRIHNDNVKSETVANDKKDQKQNSHIIFPINKQSICDINGNNGDLKLIPTIIKQTKSITCTKNTKYYNVAKDIIDNDYSFLPTFIKSDLTNGPASRCENINCKKPVFDHVTYEFTFGKIVLIDSTEDIILSAAFCSKCCADAWKKHKNYLIPWQLVE